MIMGLGEGEGDSHDVDIILAEGLLNDYSWLQSEVKNLGKRDYVNK